MLKLRSATAGVKWTRLRATIGPEGNLLDPAFSSFVGLYPIASRHGMTAGELALMYNQHFGIGVVIGHQLGIGGAVVRLAGRQRQAEGQAMDVGAEVDLGREATARAPKALAVRPPFAPAAQ